MGQININILKKPNVDAIGKVVASQANDVNCFRLWNIFAKTSSGGWIEFSTASPGSISITKTNPAGPYLSEDLIGGGVTTWEAEFHGYVSPNANLNTQTTVLTIMLYDTMGGSLLDTEVITHYHSQLLC